MLNTTIKSMINSYSLLALAVSFSLGFYTHYKYSQANLVKQLVKVREEDKKQIEKSHRENIILEKTLEEVRTAFDIKQKQLNQLETLTQEREVVETSDKGIKTVIKHDKNPYLSKELVEVLNAD